MMKTKIFFAFIFVLFTGYTFSQSLNDVQIFKIDNTKDTIIQCKSGSRLMIPKLSFQFPKEGLNNQLIIKVVEAFSQDEMVLAKLSTETNKSSLVSNGMIRIQAFYKDQKIELLDNHAIEVSTPATAGLKDMTLFNLENPDASNWQITKQEVTMDTCDSYQEVISWDYRKASKSEYKKWKRNTPEENKPAPKLFGGKEINLFRKKEYFIPIPVDTTWRCVKKDTTYYEFKISSLGWYNIDVLNKVRNPVVVQAHTEEDLQVYLILKNRKVCLKGRTKDGVNYKFRRVGINRQAAIIAYRQIDVDFVKFTMKKFYTGKEKVHLKQATTVSIEEFKKIIKRLR